MSIFHPVDHDPRKGGRMRRRKRSGPPQYRQRLRFESLENRVMLNADAAVGEMLLLDDPDAAPIAEAAGASYGAATTTEQDSAELPRFTSAEQLAQYLTEDALDRYSELFGQPGYHGNYRPRTPYDEMAVVWAAGSRVLLNGESSGHSNTNTQVAGVDEGDLVETDGEYLYVLSGEELVILDARPAEELRVASRVPIEGTPFALYLHGDRLTVLSRPTDANIYRSDIFVVDSWRAYPYRQPNTTLSVFDVSDREAPRLVQRTNIDGSLVDSRAIGDFVYLVLRNNMMVLPSPRLVHYSMVDDTAEPGHGIGWVRPDAHGIVAEYFYETQEQYIQWVQQEALDLALPHFLSYDAEGQLIASGLLSEATDVYRPLDPDSSGLLSVVVFDIAGDQPGPVSSTSVPADYASEVYVSTESLYLLDYGHGRWSRGGEETSILKFDFSENGRSVELVALGTVPGHVLNQFSADEYDGYLRIATTQGWAGRWIGQGGSQNNVYVLQQHGESLEIVGRLENLAPGEKIYSARFMGDRAFVVTYRKVDPLFAIDLSDATDPQVEGELKIPGFSNYLHPFGERYLIGLGRNADENTGLFQDPQVSLFDVDDLGDPVLLDRFTIESGRAGGLSIFDDHHAIAYFPEHQVLTVSVAAGWAWGGGAGGGRNYSRTDLWVLKIDVSPDTGDPDTSDGEIQFLGRIEHDSAVRRSVRIDDLLYSVSEDTVTVHPILEPDSQIAEVYFGVEQLGRLDFVEFDGLDLSVGDRWYRFETTHQGLLTLEVTGPAAVDMALYDAGGERLWAVSGSRVDWQVDAGQSYSLRVRGIGDNYRLRLVNLVQQDSGELIVGGTDGEDRFEFDAAAFTVRLGGVEYALDRAEVRSIAFDGGNRNDTALLIGTDGDEIVELAPGRGTLEGHGYRVSVVGVESITVEGLGGSDQATLYGSTGNDTFVATPTYARLFGAGFSIRVSEFTSVSAHAGPLVGLVPRPTDGSDGFDMAKFYDSPGDDRYVTTPRYAGLSGDGFDNRAVGFDAVHAYATAGGFDRAKMYDSAEDDTFYAGPIEGGLFGDRFFNRAKFFEQVHAFATAGGVDRANLFDSAGDDTFFSNPVQGVLRGNGFYNRAKFFEQVYARGSSGGNDRANLNDSPQADRLEAGGNRARLSAVDLSFLYEVTDFDYVRAAGGDGQDTKEIRAVDFILALD